MPVKMTEQQLAFFQELMAPFRDDELSLVPARGGKKMLTYIDKRALSNRLDSVCGPWGWYPEYEATNRGYKCRLFIQVPMENGTWVYIGKDDGAGFEEMGAKNRETGEFEYDVDNDEKSAYTNAFRRAAQDAWGIGRYLYGKGIPTFLDPNATAGTPTPNRPHNDGGPPAPAPPQANTAPTPQQNYGNGPAAQPQQQRQGFDNFKIPPPGKPVWAWAKEMEKVFETKLTDGMKRDAVELGFSEVFSAWTKEELDAIAVKAIGFIKTLPTYKGQFDHINTEQGDHVAAHPAQPLNAQTANAVANGQGVNVADLRRTLVAKMQEHIFKQIGKEADPTALKAGFMQIASCVPNCEGKTGLVPDSLANLSDVVWLKGMIAFVEDQIRNAVSPQVPAASNDIPF